eukprot:TRINITY_DN27512_c0_g1_i1.p1 TRINITY_DN27512_c0_g1~~TRINITY_DN27512_c0_g1_i1.p1  ORF type:complete len:339 (+),score=49.58 TRINITY_DN27512_c0_g1_i1:402-1418(+)
MSRLLGIMSRILQEKGDSDINSDDIICKMWEFSTQHNVMWWHNLSRVLAGCTPDGLNRFLMKANLERMWRDLQPSSNVWNVIQVISKNAFGRRILNEQLSRFTSCTFPISTLNQAKLVEILSDSSYIDCDLLKYIEYLIQNNDPKLFSFAIFSLYHLIHNVHAREASCVDQIKLLCEKLLIRIPIFKDRCVTDWSEWINTTINRKQLHYHNLVRMDIHNKYSSGFFVSSDGLVVRHKFCADFSSIIASHAVTKGKWYYEVTIHHSGVFQIGWANTSFEAHSKFGWGVGDDSNSWAIDLKRLRAWSKTPTCQFQKLDYLREWEEGGVVQLYLDVEEKII